MQEGSFRCFEKIVFNDCTTGSIPIKCRLCLSEASAKCLSDVLLEGFPSGQRDQTVNLTRELRWFKSTPLHHSDVRPGWYKQIITCDMFKVRNYGI